MIRRLPAMTALALIACHESPGAHEVFVTEVLPILERGCTSSSCHGAPPDELGAHGTGRFMIALDTDHRVASATQARAAARRFVDTTAPDFSTLLRKPLAVSQGGLGHYGGINLRDPDDPAYRTIARWIALESDGGEDPEPLSPLEDVFAREVEVGLIASTCATSRCHGADSGGIPFKLDAGLRGRIPIAATRHNYAEALAQLSLDGFPETSRLLRKAQALGAGIVHKGMNFDFFAGDPGDTRTAILDWACAERRALTGEPCAEPGAAPLTALVYVAGPLPSAPAFELDTFAPGGELRLARVSAEAGRPFTLATSESLTAGRFAGPIDVRDPAASRDGRALVFAVRQDAERGHRLYHLDLETRELRPLTDDAWRGGLVDPVQASRGSDRDPTFGPGNTVFFVSSRGGGAADRGELLDAEIYSLDLGDPTRPPTRWTFTPHIERRPVFFDLGPESGGELGFTALRDVFEPTARAHSFRFPLDLATEYHQHFGITPRESFHYDTHELPDGRYLAVVGELPGLGELGRLAVVDRNFGPELQDPALAASMERYEPPMVFVTDGAEYRDPSPLADGSLLVARLSSPFPGSNTHIEHLILRERPDGRGPTIASRRTLLSAPHTSLSEPTPLWVRAPIHATLPPRAERATGLLLHQGMPLIDALLANLPPAGVKTPLSGIAAVRLVEHIETPRDWYRATPDAPGRPARVLGELPVEPDGSFQAELPAGVPFRVQALDAAGMHIGTMHDRWFYALPGQTLRLGVGETPHGERYATQCASCHGNLDGSPEPPALEHPDAVTSASLTLARYERQDPRLPRAPPQLGELSRVELDRERHIGPLLARRCGTCHDSPEVFLDEKAGLIDRVWGRARTSHLIELLVGHELEAPRALSPDTPSHSGHLTREELGALIRWIEVGAPYRLPGDPP